MDNVIEADHVLGVVYLIDDDLDEQAYIKANPFIELNPILLTEIRKEAIEASRDVGASGRVQHQTTQQAGSGVVTWINLTR